MKRLALILTALLPVLAALAADGWYDVVVYGEPLDLSGEAYGGYETLQVSAKEGYDCFDTFRAKLVLVNPKTHERSMSGKVLETIKAKQPLAEVELLKTADILKLIHEKVGVAKRIPCKPEGVFYSEQRIPSTSAPMALIAEAKVVEPDGCLVSSSLHAQYPDSSYSWGHNRTFDSTKVGVWQRQRSMVSFTRKVFANYVSMGAGNSFGKYEFKDPWLLVYKPETLPTLDTWPVQKDAFDEKPCFRVRDVATGSPYLAPTALKVPIGFKSDIKKMNGARHVTATLSEPVGKDRALSLVYAIPLPKGEVAWWNGPRSSVKTDAGSEEQRVSIVTDAGGGELSIWPLGAVTVGNRGIAIGMDPAKPAHYRIGLSPALRRLYIVFDLGLAQERPIAEVSFQVFSFEASDGFRGALEKYAKINAAAFVSRIPKHGGWFAFDKLSEMPHYEDFGIRFKEHYNEPDWDDAHGIYTFRYQEPGTWWMWLGGTNGRKHPSYAESLAHAEKEAREGKGATHKLALSWKASVFHGEDGRPLCEPCDRNWCKGCLWSINSAPGIVGEVTDYKVKQSEEDFERYESGKFPKGVDGEYIDSAHLWMTQPLDYNRAHFAAMKTPLTYSPQSHRPAIYKGLISYEYSADLMRRLRKRGKFLFANTTVESWSWLVPTLDVIGSEVNFCSKGEWKVLSHDDLMFRRAICGKKPYTMINTFDPKNYPQEFAEKYFKISLAYGMLAGFEPILYQPENAAFRERDRPLFRKYMPLSILLSEAGWHPVNRLVACDDANILTEQFGNRYATVFNAGKETASISLKLLGEAKSGQVIERVKGASYDLQKDKLVLAPGDVMMLDWGEAH